ncbi:MAG: zinc-dependent peptidase [Cyclobacteriaceae bacterium]
MEIAVLIGLGLIVLLVFILRKKPKEMMEKPTILTPEKWKTFLRKQVNFYRNLNETQKLQFELDIQRFLEAVRITGVQTEITLEDRLLVASSAVIPLFGFPEWTYNHLDEVILYPNSFDRNFNIGSTEEIITGMVGNGSMEGKMILSKPALHVGFDISNDKKNVGIHEFVHLFDKETGSIDGVPPGFENKSYVLPWLDFVKEKTNEIVAKQSDINDYGATNRQEFLAVTGEYFFERPHLLKKKHPKLYEKLSQLFNQDMTAIIDPSSFVESTHPSRNSPCPCGSGVKYKWCCLE